MKRIYEAPAYGPQGKCYWADTVEGDDWPALPGPRHSEVAIIGGGFTGLSAALHLAQDGVEVTVQNGKFGPYLTKGSDSRSLDNEEQLLTITLDECLTILAQPKKYGRARTKPPLRELGTDPHSDRTILLKDGQYGPYVTDGETNASLRRGDSVEEISDERAAELLAERRAKGPAKKKPRRRKS